MVINLLKNLDKEFLLNNNLGGYGTVYEAINKKTNEKRAIKVVDKSTVNKEEEADILSEIEVLKQLDHPNIMKIYEFGSDKHYYYLVNEYFLLFNSGILKEANYMMKLIEGTICQKKMQLILSSN